MTRETTTSLGVKLDEQLRIINKIDKKVAVIEEHLRGLNGKVQVYDTKFKDVNMRIDGLNTKVLLATGGLTVLLIVLRVVNIL